MSEMKRLSDRNRAIQEMLTSGEGLKTFYRFVANNPHIALHDACQIVIERPSASISPATPDGAFRNAWRAGSISERTHRSAIGFRTDGLR